jgi:hypothetical protein
MNQHLPPEHQMTWEALNQNKFIPFQVMPGMPDEINLAKRFGVTEEKCLIAETGYETAVEQFKGFDLAAAVNEGHKGKISYFGSIHYEYNPDLRKINKNYITMVQVFLIEGKGYYGQLYVASCKNKGGFFEIAENMHPVKIDLELKQFITIEKEHGEKRGFRFQDRLKCENIEAVIDSVIGKIVETPEATFEPVPNMDPEFDPDEPESWQEGHSDPDWWRKGPKGPPEQSGDHEL